MRQSGMRWTTEPRRCAEGAAAAPGMNINIVSRFSAQSGAIINRNYTSVQPNSHTYIYWSLRRSDLVTVLTNEVEYAQRCFLASLTQAPQRSLGESVLVTLWLASRERFNIRIRFRFST